MDEKKINVVDLDGTLIHYNSLTKYTIHGLRYWRCFLPILYFSLLRILCIIPIEVFQKNLLIRMRKTKNYENEMKKLSNSLYHDIDASVFRFILKQTDERTINVLCTASPEDYVKFLAEMLGWEFLSSTLDDNDGSFFHMYGENKVTALRKCYPPQRYIYHVALSDSKSDSALLRLFHSSYYVHRGSLISN
jgi:hypothetical protein